MSGKKGIYWHQGMFMQPQHFQLAERHGQFRMKPLLEVGLPHFWGIGSLKIERNAVASRFIEIRSAQLIFPDRTYVEFPGNAVLAPRLFDNACVAGEKSQTVYLGLRKLNEEGNNATLCDTVEAAAAAQTRYACLNPSDNVPDLYSAGPPAPVNTLVHVLKVFFESEIANLGQYELIPIAQLIKIGETVAFSENFIAPCYAIGGSEPLTQILREICGVLTKRAQKLQELKSPREMKNAALDPEYVVFLLALRSLNRACPYLLHLTMTAQTHPWVVYGALRQLVGELSAFSERFDMLGEAEDSTGGLPSYDHLALHQCFSRAHALVNSILNGMSIGPDYTTILEYRNGYFVGQLPRDVFDRGNVFYLVLRSERLATLLTNTVRLAAAEDMPRLTAHALPGIGLMELPNAPQRLPRRVHSHYFRIDADSELWGAVERRESIALQWLDAPDDLKAEVAVLRS